MYPLDIFCAIYEHGDLIGEMRFSWQSNDEI